MRSKKVDEMINSVLRDLDFYSTERLYIDRIILQNIVAYIEQLEKMIPTPSNPVPVEYQTLILVDKRDAVMKSEIRDKIKALEYYLNTKYKSEKAKVMKFTYNEVLEQKIKLLESLLGE